MVARLTQKQEDVLQFLRERIHGGSTPTYREIAEHFGFKSPKAATDHVQALERKGCLRRNGRRSRGIELIPPNRDTVTAPVLGRIQAGSPNEESQHIQGQLAIDKWILGSAARNRLFWLQVRGDSMTGRGVFDGDWVVADADCTRREGSMVVALIDGESTLKTLAIEKGAFLLRPENPRYGSLIPVTEMSIQGVVRLIVRQVR